MIIDEDVESGDFLDDSNVRGNEETFLFFSSSHLMGCLI